MQHILSARQFTLRDIELIFDLTSRMPDIIQQNLKPLIDCNKGLVILFYERSTRTHSTFEMAAKHLGIPILYSSQAFDTFSSAAKGESLEDTISLFCNYPNIGAIILRHPEANSAQIASEIASEYGVSIINAGDGPNEHPTQALLDLYTIADLSFGQNRYKIPEDLKEVKVVFANDIQYSRTVRSLAILLARLIKPKQIGYCAPNGVEMNASLVCEIQKEGIELVPFDSLHSAATWADFLYMTRPQIERFKPFQDNVSNLRYQHEMIQRFQPFRITTEFLDAIPLSSNCRILHPMPIDSKNFNEIAPDARNHPRCKFYQQAVNGVYIRMALLAQIFDQS